MNLTDKNIQLFAAKHYTNTQCYDLDEFLQDLQIPSHIKKLFTRYKDNGVLRERLIINHAMLFFNVFEPEAAIKLLFFKMEEEYYTYLKTLLTILNKEISFIRINDDHIIHMDSIQIDMKMFTLLGNI